MQECINLSGLLHLTKTIAPDEIYTHRFTANGGVLTLLSELAGTEDEVRCGGSTVKVVSLRYITQPEPGRPSEIEVFLEGVRYLNDSDLMKEAEPPAIPNVDVPTQPFLMPAFEKCLNEFTIHLYETAERVIDSILKQQAVTEEKKLDRAADEIVGANERAWDKAFKAIEDNRAWASEQIGKLAYMMNDSEHRIEKMEQRGTEDSGAHPPQRPLDGEAVAEVCGLVPLPDDDETPSDDRQWLVAEYVPKDPVEHDFGKWLGLKPIELEPGMTLVRTVHANEATVKLLELYDKNGQQFRVGSVVVSIFELFTITTTDEDSGRKSYTMTMKLQITKLLPGTEG